MVGQISIASVKGFSTYISQVKGERCHIDTHGKLGLGETYNSVGYLPVFKKVPLIGLSQKIDWTSEDCDFALPDNFIYFISPGAPKLVKIVIEGGSLSFSDDYASNGNLTQVSSLHKRFGVGLVSNSKYGIMKVSL